MNNILKKIEKDNIEKLVANKKIPTFRPGDTLKINVKIIEGERSRLQVFEGVCIARKNNGINSNFTVRKISHGEGVEKVFPLFSPIIDKIEVIRKGDVKRSKLYYLRDRTGKSARIADKDRGEEAAQYENIIIEDNNSKQTVENKKTDENDNNKEEKAEKVDSFEKKEKEELDLKKTDSSEQKSESTAAPADKTSDESKQ
tara:strand:- start:25 stop:624 length:600 start_codon:yes stop_codon:yes gene_type:complete